jgi:ferredoxin-like protein FixX
MTLAKGPPDDGKLELKESGCLECTSRVEELPKGKRASANTEQPLIE